MNRVPFSKSEIENGGVYDAGTSRAYPRFQTPISPLENWQRALRHEKPLWAPMRMDLSLIHIFSVLSPAW